MPRMSDGTDRRPHAISHFPELQRLTVHEPWLAHPGVRAQCMWERTGFGESAYSYFILSNGSHGTLGVLLRDHELAYMRLYASYAFAVVDGTLWAAEIRHQPVCRVFVTGGVDQRRRRTWSVLVVQRVRRYEVQITTGTLIPQTYDFRRLEDALIAAEAWLTEFEHGDDGGGGGEDPDDPSWVM
jgi:hypothetical protein